MSGSLKTEITRNGEEWKVTFTGRLDEFATLPDGSGTAPVHIDLSGISHINSFGLKLWCEWLGKQKARAAIHLYKCPIPLVRQFSIVRGTLASNTVIQSFIVPYVSLETEERMEFEFRRGQEFDGQGSLILPKPVDSKGNSMELDVAEGYFKFLTVKY